VVKMATRIDLLTSNIISDKSIKVKVELKYAYGYRDIYYEEFIKLIVKDVFSNKEDDVKTFKVLKGSVSTKDLLRKLRYRAYGRTQIYHAETLEILIPYQELKHKCLYAIIKRNSELLRRECEYEVEYSPFTLDSLSLDDHVNYVVSYIIDYAISRNLDTNEFIKKIIEKLSEREW